MTFVTGRWRIAENIPTALGGNGLSIHIAGTAYSDYEVPSIFYEGLTETETTVRVWIFGKTGEYAATEAGVRAMVNEVNVIYRQAGMHFTVTSIVQTNNATLYEPAKEACSEICDIATNTGGLELYFVNQFDGARSIAINHKTGGRVRGIIMTSNASAATLAHEIGHSCGLPDIYVNYKNVDEVVTGSITRERLPDDWRSLGNECFYSPSLTQADLLMRR